MTVGSLSCCGCQFHFTIERTIKRLVRVPGGSGTMMIHERERCQITAPPSPTAPVVIFEFKATDLE